MALSETTALLLQAFIPEDVTLSYTQGNTTQHFRVKDVYKVLKDNSTALNKPKQLGIGNVPHTWIMYRLLPVIPVYEMNLRCIALELKWGIPSSNLAKAANTIIQVMTTMSPQVLTTVYNDIDIAILALNRAIEALSSTEYKITRMACIPKASTILFAISEDHIFEIVPHGTSTQNCCLVVRELTEFIYEDVYVGFCQQTQVCPYVESLQQKYKQHMRNIIANKTITTTTMFKFILPKIKD
jgi:hypothetical protein